MVTQLSHEFSAMFREEHRAVRDALLDLVQAFQDRDRTRIQPLVARTAVLAGPHFRYEEESMYPLLVQFFGEGYINKLFQDHDLAILAAKKLLGFAEQATLTDEDVEEAVRYTRSILPHVTDCDGLSILVERLPEEQVQAIFDTRARSKAANLDLLTWATTIRGRPLADLN